MTNTPKLCKNCIYFYASHSCHAPQGVIDVDLVDGDKMYGTWDAAIHRSNGWLASKIFRTCGKEGLWYKGIK